MKKLLYALALICCSISSKADEGMWIPSLIGKNYSEMQKLGLKLTTDDIYNINKSSIKDAIVQLVKPETGSGFCTGEIISSEGLFLTNHHCAFESIQFNSSVEHDYLTNGFWAKSKDQELQAPHVAVQILVKIEDVTEKVVPKLNGLGYVERAAKLKEIETQLTEESTKGTHYIGQLKEMFGGNQYFIYVYERFLDVRLVGAPPSSIGKFGGDTDNWMWPRHTGDFSLFRIYTGPDGNPAPYSKNNIPLKPKHSLPISLKGISENDYSMILGYPARTNRYASSYELQNALSNTNPALIIIFGKKLEIMKSDMDKSAEVRIKLAAKYASLSNSYKYYLGQTEGLEKLKVVAQKRAEENNFLRWMMADTERKGKYVKVLPTLDSAFTANKENTLMTLYCNLAGLASEIASYSFQFKAISDAYKKSPVDSAAIKNTVLTLKTGINDFYKDYSLETDKKIFYNMLVLIYNNLEQAKNMEVFKSILENNKAESPEASFQKYTDALFAQTMFTSKDKVLAFLNNPSKDALENDMAFAHVSKLIGDFRTLVPTATSTAFQGIVGREKRNYIAGLMEMNPKRNFYPDANSSLRLTFGKISSYAPADGIEYGYFTTTDGIIEKENPKSEEFVVPAKLKDLISKKDFGRYADKDGKMHVAFIGNTDITGGNSGSPVINAKGQLIGAAFDGNWEAMTGDLIFDAKYKRTISVDVRYVMFIIDKFAGADNIIKEVKFEE